MIRAKDPHLRRISVAYERSKFIVPEGVPIPEGTPFSQPLLEAAISVGASSSRLATQEVEEEKEEGEQEEKTEEVLDSADGFEVFNRPQSPEVVSGDMGIQRKSQRSLLDVIEGKSRKETPERSSQTTLPPPPPPKPPQPQGAEPVDPKRRREQKGKDMVDTGRLPPTQESEDQQPLKQRKTTRGASRTGAKQTVQPSEPEA